MPLPIKRADYFSFGEGLELKQMLEKVEASDQHTTVPSYSPRTDLYADNLMPFIDKHLNYLRAHPNLDPRQYISNLELMTRIR